MKILPAQFAGQAIRRIYDEAANTWWFSVVDVVQVLTQQGDSRRRANTGTSSSADSTRRAASR